MEEQRNQITEIVKSTDLFRGNQILRPNEEETPHETIYQKEGKKILRIRELSL